MGQTGSKMAPAADGPLRVLASGYNQCELLGMDYVEEDQACPGLQPPEGEEIVRISLASMFVLMLTARRHILHAGSNRYGERGDGTRDFDPHPELHMVDLPPAVDIAAAPDHALAVLADGRVFTWGNDYSPPKRKVERRRRGRPSAACFAVRRAGAVEGVRDAIRVFAGRVWRCEGNLHFVLRSCGAVAAWGNNEYRALCLDTDEKFLSAPRTVPALSGIGVIHIECTRSDGAALLADGGAVTWGFRTHGCVRRISCGEGPYRSIALSDFYDTDCIVVDRNGSRWLIMSEDRSEVPIILYYGRIILCTSTSREYLTDPWRTVRIALEGSGAEHIMERSNGTRAAWCLARAEAAAAAALAVLMEGVVIKGQTGATRMYLELYNSASAAERDDQVDASVEAILLQCATIKGAAPKEDFQIMYRDLHAIVNRACSTSLPGVKPVLRRVLLYWSAAEVGPPGADTNAKLDGKALEFCSWVNLALGRGYDPELMKRVVPYVRTLNQFLNTRKQIGMYPHWGKIRDSHWQLYRGGGFDLVHRGWYERMATSKEPFRQLRGLSTTLKRDVAEAFAARAAAYGAKPVLWIVKISNRPPHCLQVNYLEPGLSLYTGEEEFLFQCRSVFFVDSVDFSSTPFVITLEAAQDNLHHSDYLPVAPRG
eukprot:TRINITY_DN3052_c0_g1_i8.p1 TRINITY_DN3052_c0_g1~~TRINITY_DN3052_c0_g1_i8.p1  ORF type:complete len:680 (+),score=148.56 TRINITY_DN3052_c0_g1_i8:80-2041(+)